jgi:hypothetical protein
MNLFEIPRAITVILLVGVGYALAEVGGYIIKLAAWVGNHHDV